MNEPYVSNCTSIYRGVVEINEDPKNLGRCKIRVPSIHGELLYPPDILPWARPIASSPINSRRGSVNIPDIGDIVWVFFEGADKNFPVYLGGTYATEDIDVNPDVIDLYIEEDSRLSYYRNERKYVLKVKDNSISITPELISLLGNISIEESLNIEGNLTVSGTTTVYKLVYKSDDPSSDDPEDSDPEIDIEKLPLDETLCCKAGKLAVNTTNDVQVDNTLPITSAAVAAQVGNIEVLLKTI